MTWQNLWQWHHDRMALFIDRSLFRDLSQFKQAAWRAQPAHTNVKSVSQSKVACCPSQAWLLLLHRTNTRPVGYTFTGKHFRLHQNSEQILQPTSAFADLTVEHTVTPEWTPQAPHIGVCKLITISSLAGNDLGTAGSVQHAKVKQGGFSISHDVFSELPLPTEKNH